MQRWGQAYETKQLRSIPITDNVASWWDHVTSRLATHGREHKPRAAAAHEPVWRRACVLAHRAVPVPGRAGGQLWSDAATVRHCTICRQLSSVTRHEAACDLKAGNVVHSQSLWIRPCLCPRLVHRSCFERLWREDLKDRNDALEFLPDQRPRCEVCKTTYRTQKRLSRSFYELVSWTWRDLTRGELAWNLLTLNVPLVLFLIQVLLSLANLKIQRTPVGVTIRLAPTIRFPSWQIFIFTLFYHFLLLIFLSRRFQRSIIHIFPGRLYKVYLRLYASILVSFIVILVAFIDTPLEIDLGEFSWPIRFVAYVAAAWWTVTSTTIIYIFWKTSYRVEVPTDVLPRPVVQGGASECMYCTLGLCRS